MTGDKQVILLAEDDADIRELLRSSLEAEASASNLDLEVVECADGAEAISQAASRRFQCVITDLKMPKASGEQLIKAMQVNQLNASTPTLVVSGHAYDEFSEFCDRYSHIKVFQKPFAANLVAQAVVRELRLGRVDDRPPVFLLKPFMDGLQAICGKDLNLYAQTHQPVIKRPGDQLPGSYFCSMNIVSDAVKTRFHLSFDKDILAHARTSIYLQSKTMNWATMPLEAIARLLIIDLLERSARSLQDCMGGVPRLSSLSIYSDTTGKDYQEMLGATGVTVMVRTNKGQITAGAFTRGAP